MPSNEPPFCKSDIAVICEFIVLFNPVIKVELKLILLKLDVIVEFKLFIKCVLDETSLKFLLIKLVLELILLNCVVDEHLNYLLNVYLMKYY